MAEITFQINDIHCGKCVEKIRQALENLAGLEEAHFDLGENLGVMSFEQAANISGARFVVQKGKLAKLERSIANFMLDVHTEEFNYEEVNVPILVKSDALYGTGQLPKFEDDLFERISRQISKYKKN